MFQIIADTCRLTIMEMSLPHSSLRARINVFGTIGLMTYSCMALLSYAQAATLWASEIAEAPRTGRFFEGLGRTIDSIPVVSTVLQATSRLFESNTHAIVAYWITLACATVAMLALVLELGRHREVADAAIAKLLFKWSVAFAAAASLAFPIFTQDLWLSAAWGRMIAAGVNPYHNYFTLPSLRGLPLDHFPMIMSYGPLWALISGAIMMVARNSVLVTAILFKGLLAAAWIGSLALIQRLMWNRSSFSLCLATALFGWAPLGITQFLAEGHNDIVMIFLALLWFSLLLRGRWTAPIALMLSVLCKYVMAPLFLVDAIYVLRLERVHWRQYVMRLIVPTILGLAVFAIFYRSPQFFDGLWVVSKWHFLQPRDAVAAIETLSGVSLWPLGFILSALFPLVAIYCCVDCFRHATFEGLLKATIAILASICFAAVSHLWLWYMIWSLAFAVQLPAWWLSRFIIAVAVLIPFAVAWWFSPFAHQMAALVMYVAALLGTLLSGYIRRSGEGAHKLRRICAR
jgi:alpha-1,6-mannosyltransferase